MKIAQIKNYVGLNGPFLINAKKCQTILAQNYSENSQISTKFHEFFLVGKNDLDTNRKVIVQTTGYVRLDQTIPQQVSVYALFGRVHNILTYLFSKFFGKILPWIQFQKFCESFSLKENCLFHFRMKKTYPYRTALNFHKTIFFLFFSFCTYIEKLFFLLLVVCIHRTFSQNALQVVCPGLQSSCMKYGKFSPN